MQKQLIKATVKLEKSLWVVLFERSGNDGYQVARTVFGNEPTDPVLYEYISTHFYQLKFTQSHDYKINIKRKNPKRIQREVRREMAAAKLGMLNTTRAQDVLRCEIEKNKKEKKQVDKLKRLAQIQEKFLLHQAKKKKKKRGH